LASVVLALAFLVVVHGRTVPTRLSVLVSQAYLPSAFGVGLVALGAVLALPLARASTRELALLVLVTAALLAACGALFVVDKHDKSLAWAKVKGLLAPR
jgi:hypothetical protein